MIFSMPTSVAPTSPSRRHCRSCQMGGPSSSQLPDSTRPASRELQPCPPRRLRCVIFARTLASELIRRNIRVNAVSPGVIETPLFGKLGLGEADAQQLAQTLLQQIPAKRFGKP